jgi:hypothetical protein
MQEKQEIPIKKKEHKCAAKETMETLTGKVDLLRRDMRTMERRHEEDVRKLWIRIAALTVTVAILTGNEHILGWALEVLGL